MTHMLYASNILLVPAYRNVQNQFSLIACYSWYNVQRFRIFRY